MKKLVTLTLVLLTMCSFAQIDTIYKPLGGPLGLIHHNNWIYVAEAYKDQISKIDLNNPSDTPLVVASGMGTPNYMALSGSELYFTCYNSGKISKVSINGGTSTTIKSNLQSPKDIVVVGNDIYYSTPHSIYKMDKSGSTPVSVLTGLDGPISLAYKDNYIYYSEFQNNKISKFSTGSSSPTPTTVVNGLSGPYGGMTFAGNHLYFFQLTSKELSVIDVSQGSPSPTNFASDVNGGDIIFVGVHMYISDFMKSSVIRYSNVTEISDVADNSEILIYPNPARDYLNVVSNKNIKDYKIFNAQGQLLRNEEAPRSERIELLGLAPGLYFIQFDNNTAKRFIIH